MSEIHFDNPNTSPEAFDADWEAWNEAVMAGFPMERCPNDFVREAAEAEEDDSDSDRTGADYADWDGYESEDDVPMDGDFDSAMASAGHGTDEDYGGGDERY